MNNTEMMNLVASGLTEMKVPATEQTLAQLDQFADRVLETNKVMNLTAITDPEGFAQKHYLDCASLLTVTSFDGKNVIDVGCGAGFPGVPLKLLCPSCTMTLLDSQGKRIRFLQECIDGMGLSGMTAVQERAEDFAQTHRETYDIAVSRAVAKLDVLAELSLPMVKIDGRFIAMKSKNSMEEIDDAERAIEILGGEVERFDDFTIPGTDIVHRLVVIHKVLESPKKYPRSYQKISAEPL